MGNGHSIPSGSHPTPPIPDGTRRPPQEASIARMPNGSRTSPRLASPYSAGEGDGVVGSNAGSNDDDHSGINGPEPADEREARRQRRSTAAAAASAASTGSSDGADATDIDDEQRHKTPGGASRGGKGGARSTAGAVPPGEAAAAAVTPASSHEEEGGDDAMDVDEGPSVERGAGGGAAGLGGGKAAVRMEEVASCEEAEELDGNDGGKEGAGEATQCPKEAGGTPMGQDELSGDENGSVDAVEGHKDVSLGVGDVEAEDAAEQPPADGIVSLREAAASGCAKCRKELETGAKTRKEHADQCPRKRTALRVVTPPCDASVEGGEGPTRRLRSNAKIPSSSSDEDSSEEEEEEEEEEKAAKSSNRDVVLSLHDNRYKEVMWKHYRMLGKARDAEREVEIGKEILSSFKREMGSEGKFFKREGQGAHGRDVEVDDDAALAKIRADISRRMKNYRAWWGEANDKAERKSKAGNRERKAKTAGEEPVDKLRRHVERPAPSSDEPVRRLRSNTQLSSSSSDEESSSGGSSSESESDSSDDENLSPFERLRKENIKRNNQRLRSLGLLTKPTTAGGSRGRRTSALTRLLTGDSAGNDGAKPASNARQKKQPAAPLPKRTLPKRTGVAHRGNKEDSSDESEEEVEVEASLEEAAKAGCRKCQKELDTGVKTRKGHDEDCPRKKRYRYVAVDEESEEDCEEEGDAGVRPWSTKEDKELEKRVRLHGEGKWKVILDNSRILSEWCEQAGKAGVKKGSDAIRGRWSTLTRRMDHCNEDEDSGEECEERDGEVRPWSAKEDKELEKRVRLHGEGKWKVIFDSSRILSEWCEQAGIQHGPKALGKRWRRRRDEDGDEEIEERDNEVRPWSTKEDRELEKRVSLHGEGKWKTIFDNSRILREWCDQAGVTRGPDVLGKRWWRRRERCNEEEGDEESSEEEVEVEASFEEAAEAGCRKCLRELETGVKTRKEHDEDCPRKRRYRYVAVDEESGEESSEECEDEVRPWSAKEDKELEKRVRLHGEGKWKVILDNSRILREWCEQAGIKRPSDTLWRRWRRQTESRDVAMDETVDEDSDEESEEIEGEVKASLKEAAEAGCRKCQKELDTGVKTRKGHDEDCPRKRRCVAVNEESDEGCEEEDIDEVRPWSAKEDKELVKRVRLHGEGKWKVILDHSRILSEWCDQAGVKKRSDALWSRWRRRIGRCSDDEEASSSDNEVQDGDSLASSSNESSESAGSVDVSVVAGDEGSVVSSLDESVHKSSEKQSTTPRREDWVHVPEMNRQSLLRSICDSRASSDNLTVVQLSKRAGTDKDSLQKFFLLVPDIIAKGQHEGRAIPPDSLFVMLQVDSIISVYDKHDGTQLGDDSTSWDVYAQATSDDGIAAVRYWAVDDKGTHVARFDVPTTGGVYKFYSLLHHQERDRSERANLRSLADDQKETSPPRDPLAVVSSGDESTLPAHLYFALEQMQIAPKIPKLSCLHCSSDDCSGFMFTPSSEGALARDISSSVVDHLQGCERCPPEIRKELARLLHKKEKSLRSAGQVRSTSDEEDEEDELQAFYRELWRRMHDAPDDGTFAKCLNPGGCESNVALGKRKEPPSTATRPSPENPFPSAKKQKKTSTSRRSKEDLALRPSNAVSNQSGGAFASSNPPGNAHQDPEAVAKAFKMLRANLAESMKRTVASRHQVLHQNQKQNDFDLFVSVAKGTRTKLQALQPMVMQLGDLEASEEIGKIMASSSQYALASDLPSAYAALNDASAKIKALEQRLAKGPGQAPLRAVTGAEDASSVERAKISSAVYRILWSNMPPSLKDTTSKEEVARIADSVERKLYCTASSPRAYSDLSTLHWRMKALAVAYLNHLGKDSDVSDACATLSAAASESLVRCVIVLVRILSS